MVPLLGALLSRGSGTEGRRGAAPPRGFLGLGRPGAGEAGPSRGGEGRDRGGGGGSGGPGLPGCGVRARRPPAARRGASARRALHSPSLHQRLREEGRDPSLAHFPPSQTRTLPRSRSLTPSLSRSHTRAHTPPRLPLSRPLSLRLLRAAAGLRTRPPAPARPPHAASRSGRTGGSPGPLPEVRARGAAGGAAGSPPRGGCPAGREPPGRQERPGRRRGGRASRRRGSPGARARPPRAPSSRRGGREGVSHVQTFPGAEPSRLSARSPRPPVPPRPAPPAARPEPPGPPRAAGWQRRGPSPRAERGWRGGARSLPGGRDPGVPRAPTPCCRGSAAGPLPEAGSGPGKYRTARA